MTTPTPPIARRSPVVDRIAGVSPALSRRAFALALSLVLLLGLALLDRPASGAAWTPGPLPFGRTWLPRATYPAYMLGQRFSDPVHNRLFLGDSSGQSLRVIDAADGRQLAEIPYSIGYLTIAGDGQHIYAATYHHTPQIFVIDNETLAELTNFSYRCSSDDDTYCDARLMAAPGNGRLYIVIAEESKIDIVDAGNGQVVNTLQLPGDVIAPSYGISGLAVNGNTLFVSISFLDDEQYHAMILAYDLSQPNAPALIDQLELDEPAHSLHVSPDGATLTAQVLGYLYQFSTTPLALTRIYTTDDHGFESYGFDADGNILTMFHPSNAEQSIAVIDPTDGQYVRVLGGADAAPPYDNLYHVLPLAGGQIATLHSESIIVRRPVDYAAAVPLVMNSACPGGLIDDYFRDPTSGWPRRNDAELITDYTAEGYLIAFRDAGAWAGVSRGDVWHNADLVATRAKLLGGFGPPQYGSFGIIFGLNDDWSDFYSFEVVPFRHGWVLFHFHDGAWEEVRAEYHIGVSENNELGVGIDRYNLTGIAWLTINGEWVIPMPEVTGRVGLAAGSFWPGTRANFFDYHFHGDNCEPARRGPAALDVSPPLPPRVLSDE